jgi:hypothetical protein
LRFGSKIWVPVVMFLLRNSRIVGIRIDDLSFADVALRRKQAKFGKQDEPFSMFMNRV